MAASQTSGRIQKIKRSFRKEGGDSTLQSRLKQTPSLRGWEVLGPRGFPEYLDREILSLWIDRAVVREMNTQLDRAVCYSLLDPSPLISKLTQSHATAAYKNECLFHTYVALNFGMRMNMDIGGKGGKSGKKPL